MASPTPPTSATRSAPSATTPRVKAPMARAAAFHDPECNRIMARRMLEHARRECAEISRFRLERPIHHRHRIAAEFSQDVVGQRARRRKAVKCAHRGTQRIEADMRARSVVAERESASANDGFLALNARDRRRAGAGDHQPAVRAGVRADASGGRVVRRAHKPKAGKSRGHSRLVASLLEAGKPESHCDRPPIAFAEPGLSQNLVDGRAHSRDRGGKIDMNVRRRANRLGKRSSVGVAQPRAAAGRAAVDAEKERRAGHAAALAFNSSRIAAAAARSAFAASVGVSRFAFAPRGDCSGVTGRCTKTAGIADRFSLRYCKAPK